MRLVNRIKNRKGFSLAETLLAILILLLVSTIVATGVPVARDAYEKVVLSANAQTMLASAVSALREELGTAWDVKCDPENANAIVYYSASTGARTRLCLGAYKVGSEKPTDAILVQDNYIESSLLPTDSGTALGKARLLVQDSDKGGVAALYATCDPIAYTNGDKSVTINNLVVKTAGGTLLTKPINIQIDIASAVTTNS